MNVRMPPQTVPNAYLEKVISKDRYTHKTKKQHIHSIVLPLEHLLINFFKYLNILHFYSR